MIFQHTIQDKIFTKKKIVVKMNSKLIRYIYIFIDRSYSLIE